MDGAQLEMRESQKLGEPKLGDGPLLFGIDKTVTGHLTKVVFNMVF